MKCLAITMLLLSCGTKNDENKPPPPSAVVPKPTTPPEPKAFELPQSCKDHGAVIEKLKACDKLDAETKKIFIEGYADKAKSAVWKGERDIPVDMLAKSCQTDVDNISKIVANACP